MKSVLRQGIDGAIQAGRSNALFTGVFGFLTWSGSLFRQDKYANKYTQETLVEKATKTAFSPSGSTNSP